MPTVNVIRAWKDEEYRRSLTEAERSQVPDHPAGLVELENADLELATGGGGVITVNLSCHVTCALNNCAQK
jgi:mersacidin/lichenicidin family type 2 lantibiotic